MGISYENSEEQYIQLELDRVHASGKYIAKDIFLRILVAIIFVGLCYTKYSIDMDLYGYLTEAASPVILVYIVCGILWIILLPILYWKLKSIIITKEIENKKFNFQGNVSVKLEDDQIVVETFDSISKYKWDSIKSIKVNKKIIIINVLGDKSILVPTSAFENTDILEVFVKNIEENIKSIVKEQEV